MPIQPVLRADVLIYELPEGSRYVLPRRRLRWLRWAGLAPLGFGLVLVVFNTLLTAGFWTGFGALQALLLIPFWGATIGVTVLGLSLIAGKSEIELKGNRLRTIERLGILRWSWKRRVEDGFRIKVVTLPFTAGPLSHIGMAVVDLGDERSLWLAPAYDEDLVWPLAHHVADALRSREIDGRVVGMREGTQLDVRDVSYLPPQARITWERHENGVTVTLSPTGFRGRAKWTLLPGVVWSFMIGAFTAIAFVAGRDEHWVITMSLAAIIAAHWLLAIGFLVLAIDIAYSRAAVAVLNDQLMIVQSGLFGSTRREFNRDDVESIGVGPSGGQEGNPVQELQVLLRNGRAVGLGQGRDTEELHWIATLLRSALNLSTQTPKL